MHVTWTYASVLTPVIKAHCRQSYINVWTLTYKVASFPGYVTVILNEFICSQCQQWYHRRSLCIVSSTLWHYTMVENICLFLHKRHVWSWINSWKFSHCSCLMSSYALFDNKTVVKEIPRAYNKSGQTSGWVSHVDIICSVYFIALLICDRYSIGSSDLITGLIK